VWPSHFNPASFQDCFDMGAVTKACIVPLFASSKACLKKRKDACPFSLEGDPFFTVFKGFSTSKRDREGKMVSFVLSKG